MPSHKHLHARHAHQHWDNFVRGVENVANELNPFKDAPHALQERAPETVYKTVYTTMSATFDGPIAGYTTVGVPADTTQKIKSGDDATAAAAAAKETSAAKVDKSDDASSATESFPKSLASSSIDLEDESTLALAGSTTLKQQTPFLTSVDTTSSLSATGVAASSSSTPSAGSSVSENSDSSPAVKAGIAIGVLGGIFAIGLLVWFLFSKRRKQLEQQRAQDDEKINGSFAGGRTASIRTTRTSATAPRLSLRPVTQFNPTFNERRSSKGAGLMLATTGGSPQSATRDNGGSLWERPSTAHSNSPENPFNDSARANSPTGNAPQEPLTNPFDSPENIVGMAQTTDLPATPTMTATTGTDSAATSAAAVGAASLGASTTLARKASTRKEAPEPLDLTMPMVPPSPTGTEFSMNSVAPGQSPGPSKSAAAIAEAGGPPSSTVHRVQLDFKPSMDDELGLQAGQLVRILHEYDDGWALCIRLDRSQQGVVPRTCLSTRPVKPRPAGGPPGPRNGGPPVNPSGPRGPRGPPRGPNYTPNYPPGPPPQGRPESPMRAMNGRPQSPAHMRPYSPAGGRPMSPHTGRPASPASGRPMSPGPRVQSPGPHQQRPQSPNGMNRRHSPPGPSPMNPNNGNQFPPSQGQVGRKPVPGQAY
ncbi:hypothetical protein F5B22DRAFT_384694 [Xylaria bambusicola]|uniref:uncharacterized protein n=1 Tax=Xylaria bambusicola TaxID=326684 RepID=UPI002007A780|nr:uncharacterized protein F5B22DRAFT_384694 [Xylaria bambusicola]KAI0508794.1 hypothetical protein F5B22DRAFT_384694 [Xylaria bambusicola]